MSLQKLRDITNELDRMLVLDEAVQLSAFTRTLTEEYQTLDLPIPEWVEKAGDILREEIGRRTHAATLAELKKVEAELESLKTQGERKSDATNRLKALQKKLGMAVAR